MRKFAMLFASALVLAAPGAASAQIFDRDTTGQIPDPFGFDIPTVVVSFYATQAGVYTFDLTSVDTTVYDPYLFIYADFLNPFDPTANLLGENDDVDFPSDLNSRIIIPLETDRQYFAMLTSLFNDSFGPARLTVSGPAAVTEGSLPAVPEPASWALMIGGFALAGGAMRRRATRVSFA